MRIARKREAAVDQAPECPAEPFRHRDVLWYAVGALLVVLVLAGGLLFCFSGRWVR